jgi:hypothetical protein
MSQVDTRRATDDLLEATKAMTQADRAYNRTVGDWAEAQRAQREATEALAVAAGNMANAMAEKETANQNYTTAWVFDQNARSNG